MLRVGLTGGIASGKSVVAAMFVDLGAALVDTDRIARDLVAPGAAAYGPVRKAFGDGILAHDGSFDRAKLRSLVFSDPKLRRRLEDILHPMIRAQALRDMNAAEGPYVIAAVPLLVETGFDAIVDRVLLVHCTAELQISRVMQRDGVGADEARAILAAQVDESERMAAADDVIDNTGTLETTRAQVLSLHERYVELSGVCRATPRRAE